MGQEVALCKKCHGELSEQIVSNYKAMEKFAEGARFLEEFGWAEEDTSPRGFRRGRESSRVSKRTRGPRGSRRGLRVAGRDQGLGSTSLRDYLGEPGA